MRVGEEAVLDPLLDAGEAVAEWGWLDQRTWTREAAVREVALRLEDRSQELDALSRLVGLQDHAPTVLQF